MCFMGLYVLYVQASLKAYALIEPSPICFQSDESYILPVLLRFDGQPEIDEEV